MKPSLIIIGLGNPGKSYKKTRHNTGFAAIDILAKYFGTGAWKDRSKFHAHVAEGRILTSPILLVQPKTYMNLSGETVRKMIDFYKLPTTHILVLCDDVDLPCGTVRLRKQGSAGTHNGLKSIVEQVGEGFPRLRIGIGPKPDG
ncbi:aminoacyl-tRNA hydrolase, partial [Candidatus Peregrinibacteria bacterium]|nr:aminoacyl-tRNA hydrolase [Candidatus Peregrinibacteria bacterium]